MSIDVKLPILQDTASAGLTRRRVIQHVLAGLGTMLAHPLYARAHPVLSHLGNPDALLQAAAGASDPDWSPEFFDPKQNELLVAIAERMLPGSTEALVNRVIDRLLRADTPENQKNFVGSLAALDHESTRRFHRPISALDPNQIDQVLATCSTLKPEHPAEHNDAFDSWKTNLVLPDGGPANLRDHFENLKGWIVATYYSSEKGLRELGWNDDFYFDSPEECAHPEGHQ